MRLILLLSLCTPLVACGGGVRVDSIGWTTTDTGWSGGAAVTLTEIGEGADAVGIDGTAGLEVTRSGDDYTAEIVGTLDERDVGLRVGWGGSTTIRSCYDGPELGPPVCTTVTPPRDGRGGTVCVEIGTLSLPCYVIPAGEDVMTEAEPDVSVPVVDGGGLEHDPDIAPRSEPIAPLHPIIRDAG